MKNSVERKTVNQVSLLQGLAYGDYEGSVPVGCLKELGDTGIGTFDALNGELILLNGTVYRAAWDGAVEEVGDDEKVPFADVTFFDVDKSINLDGIGSIDALKEKLDKNIQETGKNHLYIVRAFGSFQKMKVRSVPPQKKPYRPLVEVLEKEQTVFEYEEISGTVVGLCCPEYMSNINAVGWHFHFVSEDKTAGGHVLDLSAETLDVDLDKITGFRMLLPDSEMFNAVDLSRDQSRDIKKIETGE